MGHAVAANGLDGGAYERPTRPASANMVPYAVAGMLSMLTMSSERTSVGSVEVIKRECDGRG